MNKEIRSIKILNLREQQSPQNHTNEEGQKCMYQVEFILVL